ncbi:hypothetical protein V5069_08265 [Citrobacter freundii]|uniref:hypothetical protein n=1 Tax=Citrobacter freundii TaxID=546 RepID=UPI003075F557
MGTVEKILSYQLDRDLFHSEDDKVSGIAKLAVDKGYDHLTEKQKNVLAGHLIKYCSGHTNPGGHHNDCSHELAGDELLNAYEQCDDPDTLQCESCLSEASYEQHVWDKNYSD